VKLTTVIDATAFCDRFAVTVALLNVVVEKAPQISASPGCAFVRFTRAQVKPPPVTLLTVIPPERPESDDTNASNSSLGAVVENAGLVTVVPADVRSVEVKVSIANDAGGGGVVTTRLTVVGWFRLPLTPVMVSVDVPAGVELNVLIVKVEDPDPVIVVGLNVPLAPAGNPPTPKVTTPENPLCPVIVTA
jgi:hypothetical protein